MKISNTDVAALRKEETLKMSRKYKRKDNNDRVKKG